MTLALFACTEEPNDRNTATGDLPRSVTPTMVPSSPQAPPTIPAPPTTPVLDADEDGFDVAYDCDDLDPARFPGAFEPCGDGVDHNCDGVALCKLEGTIDAELAGVLWGTVNDDNGWITLSNFADIDGDGVEDDLWLEDPATGDAVLQFGPIDVTNPPGARILAGGAGVGAFAHLIVVPDVTADGELDLLASYEDYVDGTLVLVSPADGAGTTFAHSLLPRIECAIHIPCKSALHVVPEGTYLVLVDVHDTSGLVSWIRMPLSDLVVEHAVADLSMGDYEGGHDQNLGTTFAVGGDVDGDGRDDVVMAEEWSGQIYFTSQVPTGTVEAETLPRLDMEDNMVAAVAVGNVNGGLADIAVVLEPLFGTIRSEIRIWHGPVADEDDEDQSDILLRVPEPCSIADLELADVDGDGHDDLFVIQAANTCDPIVWGVYGPLHSLDADLAVVADLQVLPRSDAFPDDLYYGDPARLDFGDADEDGFLDLLVSQWGGPVFLSGGL